MSMISLAKTTAFALLVVVSVEGFAPVRQARTPRQIFASIQANDIMMKSFNLSKEEAKPMFKIGEGEKQKIINGWGLMTFAASLVTGPIWMLAMSLVDMVCRMNENWDPNRAVFDYTGKIWCRVWLSMTKSFPTISGETDAIRESQGPCLYVANHASWLDIPIICTLVDPVFKFIAKAELAKVPLIGQQLTGVSFLSC